MTELSGRPLRSRPAGAPLSFEGGGLCDAPKLLASSGAVPGGVPQGHPDPGVDKDRDVPRLDPREPYSAAMADIVLGIFAIIAGGVMLFAGQYVLRILLPIWGFFAGFAFGAGLFAGLADERFLGSVLGWISGFVFALVFALFAYLYYAVAVILAMAAFGFAIGAGLIVALGIDWNWVAVLVGVLVGAVLGLVSVFGNMPMIVLAVLSSIAGAVSVVGGMMLMVGSLNSSDFTRAAFTKAVNDSWGWYLTLLALILVGIVAQIRQRATWRRTVRETWYVENT